MFKDIRNKNKSINFYLQNITSQLLQTSVTRLEMDKEHFLIYDDINVRNNEIQE
jgi:hypothetical protein